MSIEKINEASIEYANTIVKNHVSRFITKIMEEENISSEASIQDLLERLDLSNKAQKIPIKKTEPKSKKKKIEDSANESTSSKENISSEEPIQELLESLDLSNKAQKIPIKKKKIEDSANESTSSKEGEETSARPVSGCTYMFKKGVKKNTYCKKKVVKGQWVCSTHSSKNPSKNITSIPEEDIKENDNHSEDWEEKANEKRKIITAQVDHLLEKDIESDIEDNQYLLYENNSECEESE